MVDQWNFLEGHVLGNADHDSNSTVRSISPADAFYLFAVLVLGMCTRPSCPRRASPLVSVKDVGHAQQMQSLFCLYFAGDVP